MQIQDLLGHCIFTSPGPAGIIVDYMDDTDVLKLQSLEVFKKILESRPDRMLKALSPVLVTLITNHRDVPGFAEMHPQWQKRVLQALRKGITPFFFLNEKHEFWGERVGRNLENAHLQPELPQVRLSRDGVGVISDSCSKKRSYFFFADNANYRDFQTGKTERIRFTSKKITCLAKFHGFVIGSNRNGCIGCWDPASAAEPLFIIPSNARREIEDFVISDREPDLFGVFFYGIANNNISSWKIALYRLDIAHFLDQVSLMEEPTVSEPALAKNTVRYDVKSIALIVYAVVVTIGFVRMVQLRWKDS